MLWILQKTKSNKSFRRFRWPSNSRSIFLSAYPAVFQEPVLQKLSGTLESHSAQVDLFLHFFRILILYIHKHKNEGLQSSSFNSTRTQLFSFYVCFDSKAQCIAMCHSVITKPFMPKNTVNILSAEFTGLMFKNHLNLSLCQIYIFCLQSDCNSNFACNK